MDYKELKKDIKKLKKNRNVASMFLFSNKWKYGEFKIDMLIENKISTQIRLGGDLGNVYLTSTGIVEDGYGYKSEIVSEEVLELCQMEKITDHHMVNIIKKYNLDRKQIGIWISNKKELMVGGERIKKIGKVLRFVNPYIDEWKMIESIERMKAERLLLNIQGRENVIKTTDITDVYKTSKVSSCMADRDMSLIAKVGGSVIYVKDGANIVSRTIVYDHNMTMSKTYSTSTSITVAVEEYLYNLGYRKPKKKDKTLKIRVKDMKDIKDFIYPYMDIYKYINVEDNNLWFSKGDKESIGIAERTDGSAKWFGTP